MKRSTHRILTTHVGRLPRPGDLLQAVINLGPRVHDMELKDVASERRWP